MAPLLRCRPSPRPASALLQEMAQKHFDGRARRQLSKVDPSFSSFVPRLLPGQHFSHVVSASRSTSSRGDT